MTKAPLRMPEPPKLATHPVYEPLIRLLRDTLVSGATLAPRWGYGRNHLTNLRRRGLGIPFIKLPTGPVSGGVRYRLSDIVAAELEGMSGPATLERACLVVSACDELDEDQRAAVITKLRAALR